ncbi:hypothetical protein PMAYCL1PPCAC_22335 [Pristionchus mayeri]|uniref:F-box domain-containing protein n=1 Tax=Pristionchus mayeri TaxID=1317129 RepID=A0AAN5I5J9_9BILA|nr:hypothetical protein PMAYCL1PPCAC_22335 [Pristionchus mayeri]
MLRIKIRFSSLTVMPFDQLFRTCVWFLRKVIFKDTLFALEFPDDEERYEASTSFLEQLPQELVRKIIAHTPESIFELRMSCKFLRNQVDGFARSTMPPVKEFKFIGGFSDAPLSKKIDISTTIRNKCLALFELRLKLHNFPRYLMEKRRHSYNIDFIEYSLELREENRDKLEELLNISGRTAEVVTLRNCELRDEFVEVQTILDSIRFVSLKFSSDFLTDDAVFHLINTIKNYGVERLILSVGKNNTSDEVAVLLQLSSLVRSLAVNQRYVDGLEMRRTYFFGLENIDWAPIFVEMFKNKLDQLYIYNYEAFYLRNSSAYALIEALPALGKSLWFESNCYCTLRKKQFVDDHIIEIRKRGLFTSLHIKHISRHRHTFELWW